jgi:hypothetical protein
VRRGKCCRKVKTQQMLLKTTEFYLVGFLHHCRLGPEGLDCLLVNLELLEEKGMQKRWLALISLLTDKE